MASIFSTQNLQTFLRRKYLRPPSRPPGPPGRGGRRSPRSGPEERSPPEGRSPTELPCAAALISSAMMLLKNSVLRPRSLAPTLNRSFCGLFKDQRRTTNDWFYTVAAGAAGAGVAGAGGGVLRRASRIALIL